MRSRPPGVLNIVQGRGAAAGQRIADHALVDRISFTGSTAVGKHLLASCAGNLKRVSLELGGESPVVIYPDADLERAMDGAAMSIFGNTGQACAAGSRASATGTASRTSWPVATTPITAEAFTEIKSVAINISGA